MLEFRELFSKAKHIAVITGAGVSAESGVPTFRGQNEKWRKWLSQVLKTHVGFIWVPFWDSLRRNWLWRGALFWLDDLDCYCGLQQEEPPAKIWLDYNSECFLFAGPGDARGLLSKSIAGLGVLPIQEGRGVEQEAQRRPSGHSGVRSPAEEAGPLGGRHHAVHRWPPPPGRVQTRAQSSRWATARAMISSNTNMVEQIQKIWCALMKRITSYNAVKSRWFISLFYILQSSQINVLLCLADS